MKTNQQQQKKIDIDDRGNPRMTVRTIKYYCYKDNLFETPQLNEKLYLHYKGFKKIENLQCYPNLVTIWLNNNCISKIQGLGTLKNLICLYLNNNVISKIQGLDGLDCLSVLHLAHNKIDKIQGLAGLKVLNILNISENFLSNADSIAGLAESTLTSIDLSKNELQCSDQVFNFISSLQNISCLCMKHTPISKTYKNYRKRLICSLKKLKYLDDRAIKDIDHRLAEAWVKGGPQLQNQERLKIANEKQIKDERQTLQLNEKISRKKRREQEINALQQQKNNLLDLQYHQTKQQDLKQIERRLQILRDGPKGFQAMITDTSIKILHVDESEQQKIIQKYFFQDKLRIKQNLRKISTQNVSVRQINMEQDEKYIEAKVRKIHNLRSEDVEVKGRLAYLNKWNCKYEKLLEALLEKEKFNFQIVLKQFNQILADVAKKMMRKPKKFQLHELQYIWTQIQLQRMQLSNPQTNQNMETQSNLQL